MAWMMKDTELIDEKSFWMDGALLRCTSLHCQHQADLCQLVVFNVRGMRPEVGAD